MDFHALAGMKDYLGSAREDIHYLTDLARSIFGSAGFRQVETPVLEDARLFDRSLGTGSDIVSKEMYTIEQTDDRIIAMRPENTAGVARSVIENELMARHNQLKFFYEGSMFRHERPQSGRLRQFHQVGVEVFGRDDPLIDAEIIQLGERFLSEAEIDNPRLLINSIGCPDCRPGYLEDLTEELETHRDELCENCDRRLEENPLRVLDCKNDDCRTIYEQHAPSILDALCENCDRHFDTLKQYLDDFGVEYEIDSFLVRGLDYYRRTTFEFVAGELGSQDAVLAGGRYDGLVEELGGDPCPATGFAAGLERLMILRGSYGTREVDTRTDCFVVSFDSPSTKALFPLIKKLRSEQYPSESRPVRVEVGNPDDSVKSQFRRADRYESKIVLLMGSDEREEGIINVKRMDTGEQVPVDFAQTESCVNKILDVLESVDPEALQED